MSLTVHYPCSSPELRGLPKEKALFLARPGLVFYAHFPEGLWLHAGQRCFSALKPMNNRSENLFSLLAGAIVIAVLGGSFALFWWWSQRVEPYGRTPSPRNSVSANRREAFASVQEGEPESEPVDRAPISFRLWN